MYPTENIGIKGNRKAPSTVSILGPIALLICLWSAGVHAQVPTQDARNVNLVNTRTHMPLPSYSSLQDWERRKAYLRQQILVSTGLSPMPARTPLNPLVFGLIREKGYTIEKVLIETLPGFYLAGNLYRPLGAGKHPGILNPQGHWQYGRLEHQPLYSGPSLGVSLARQGYVVFAYDMVGYTDTVQIEHHFNSPARSLWSFGGLGLQLWDSIRSLDFLSSLPDVDAARLGVTGASGGGTQTFFLTAVDDRVQFSSPVNMVSAIMQGGDCENAPGVRLGTNSVEIAAMFAPKPMLLVSGTQDWTRNVPKEEFPAIQRIYSLYGKADNVEVVQIDAPHNYNRDSREAVYRFFAKVNSGLSAPGELQEHDIHAELLQDVMVLSGRPLPSDATDVNGVLHQWQSMGNMSLEQLSNDTSRRELLAKTLEVAVPHDIVCEHTGSQFLLGRRAAKDRIVGKWFPGHGKVAIVLDPKGGTSLENSALVTKLLHEKRPVLLLDVFQNGASVAPRDETPHEFLAFNVSDDEARVQDIVTTLAFLKSSKENTESSEIYASGDASLWATFAAAIVPWHVDLHLEDTPMLFNDADYLAHFNVPGIERAGGLLMATQLTGAN
jgi:dienelactone hydrolase